MGEGTEGVRPVRAGRRRGQLAMVPSRVPPDSCTCTPALWSGRWHYMLSCVVCRRQLWLILQKTLVVGEGRTGGKGGFPSMMEPFYQGRWL